MSTKQQAADARESLRGTFPAGSTVHVSMLHASRSGMQRAIAVYATDEEGGIHNVSWEVARAVGWNLHTRHDGVKVDGCGMDMGFHLVYTLSHLLHGDGYALKHRYI